MFEMKTVSTLCATSTVGVAAVGYSFGRPKQSELPRPVSNKRKAVVENDFDFINPTQGSSRSADSQTVLDQANPSTNVNSTLIGPLSEGGAVFSGLRPESSTNNEVSGPSAGSSNWFNPVGVPESTVADPKGSIRSRSSWFRRLSTFSSSRNTSTTSSPRPESPSVGWFNRASIPIPLGGPGSALPPNKLVKRASSQHFSGGNHLGSQRSSKTKTSTLRRPATSHQRSVTIHQLPTQNNQVNLQDLFDTPGPDRIRESPTDWRMYFEARTVKLRDEVGHPRKRDQSSLSPSSNSTVKRINPVKDILPTLMMASTIESSSSDDDGRSIPPGGFDNDRFLFNNSRSAISSGPDDLTQSSIGDHRSLAPENNWQVEHGPRQPFSLSNMFSSGSPAQWRMSRSRSLRSKPGSNVPSGGKRISSAPMATMVDQSTIVHSGDTHRPTKRRDTLEPSMLMEAPTTSPANAIINATSRHYRSNDNTPAPPESTLEPPPILPSLPSATQAAASQSLEAQSAESSALLSSPPHTIEMRPHSLSVGLSDRAETLLGSDSEPRGFNSGDEEDMDLRSETIFDSLRTGTTRSTSGAHGRRVETIFDESPPQDFSKDGLAALQNLLPNDKFQDDKDNLMEWKQSSPEQKNDFTSMKGIPKYKKGFKTPSQTKSIVPSDEYIKSSSEGTGLPVSSEVMQWDASDIREENSHWSFDEEGQEEDWDLPEDDHSSDYQLSSSQPSQRRLGLKFPELVPESSPQSTNEQPGKFNKSNLFDWSEKPSVEKNSLQGNQLRPKTVHGKQGDDGRGSRSSGRRRPSALHVRSQSVPVVPESGTKREHSNSKVKFGTWGLGSKIVSEDWNEDFEFESFDEIDVKGGNSNDSPAVERPAMIVPQNIKERQASVLGHLGLVREFALHVEDIKRLRALASSRDILNGSDAEKWKEADGIISLATLDDEDPDILASHSPSTPDSEFDAFDEGPALALSHNHTGRKSTLTIEDGTWPVDMGDSHSRESSLQSESLMSRVSSTRPRKDSTAFARNVIEIMHQQRSSSDPLLPTTTLPPQKKMPFDTTTLRDLVIHVAELKKTLAGLLQDAETVCSTPTNGFQSSDDSDDFDDFDPRDARFFEKPLAESPTLHKSQASQSKSSNGTLESPMKGQEGDTNGHMTLMTVM